MEYRSFKSTNPYRQSAYRVKGGRLAEFAKHRQRAIEGPVARKPRIPAAEFTIIVRHRSGETARLRLYRLPSGKLDISPTRAGGKISAVLANFR